MTLPYLGFDPFDLSGLPDEHGRMQILNIHTAKIRENKKLAHDVDIDELAAETKNFSGAEIEGLIRAATSTAMNRLIKVSEGIDCNYFHVIRCCALNILMESVSVTNVVLII